MQIKFKKIVGYFFKAIGIFLLALIGFYLVFLLVTKPSNDRIWSVDMTELSSASIDGDIVTLNNVRNNTYRTTSDFDVKYYQGKYSLSALEKVYLLTDPFDNLAAHTMLSFEFFEFHQPPRSAVNARIFQVRLEKTRNETAEHPGRASLVSIVCLNKEIQYLNYTEYLDMNMEKKRL